MNNFEVLMSEDIFFIKTNASKNEVIQLVANFHILKKLELTNKSLVQFIQCNGFSANDLLKEHSNLLKILRNNNYTIINLTELDQYWQELSYHI